MRSCGVIYLSEVALKCGAIMIAGGSVVDVTVNFTFAVTSD
jgi:hypothetical protein